MKLLVVEKPIRAMCDDVIGDSKFRVRFDNLNHFLKPPLTLCSEFYGL